MNKTLSPFFGLLLIAEAELGSSVGSETRLCEAEY